MTTWMVRAFLLLCLLILLAAAPSGGENLSLEQADGSTLYYYYNPPPRGGAVVAILQGSECLRVNHKYAPLIATLQRHNLGVLRVEKPGLAPDTPIGECPAAYLQSNTLERRVWDLLCVIAELRKRKDWNGRLALVGGSEGGMLAALCAPLIPETRAVALISSGGGMTFGQELQVMIADQMRRSGAPPEKIEQQRQGLERLFTRVRQEPTTLKEWGSDGKLARNTHLWLSRAAPLGMYRPLLRVDAPILVVHGADDCSTPVASARLLQEAFIRAGRTNLELRIGPGGHAPPEEVLQATLEWVVRQLNGEPGTAMRGLLTAK